MPLRPLVLGGIGAVLTLLLWSDWGGPRDAPRAAISQAETVAAEELFSTPPLASLVPNTSLSVQRVVFEPGVRQEATYPGPVVSHVLDGLLTVREPRRGGAHIPLDPGSAASSPPDHAGRGEMVLSQGYALLAENGNLGSVQNRGVEPAAVSAVLLIPIPEHPEQGASRVSEATAVP